ncbi:hypothetical protein INR49_013666 [Caranx melampygus]|nr:hypothetical protein INR49_013666 [Caranx melampygus]
MHFQERVLRGGLYLHLLSPTHAMGCSPAGDRCAAVVVSLWDWLTAEEVVVCTSVYARACRKR